MKWSSLDFPLTFRETNLGNSKNQSNNGTFQSEGHMMQTSQIYIAISIVAIAIIAILVFVVYKNKEAKKLSPLSGLAFGFVLAGLIFGNDRLVGYSLMGIGVSLAIIDIFRRMNNKQ